MKTSKKALFLLIACLLLVACSNQSMPPSSNQGKKTQETYNPESASPSQSSPQDPSSPLEQENASNRKQTFSYYISFDSKEYDQGLSYLEGLVQEKGGFFDKVDESATPPRTYKATLRVPSQNAEAFISALKESPNLNFLSQNKSSEDITTNYADTQLRIETRRKKLARLEELRQNQATLQQLLVLEEEINKTVYEIESLESQLNTMDEKVQYSTIDLTLNERATNIIRPQKVSFADRLLIAIKDSANNFISLVEGIILTIIGLLPLILILALIVFIVKKFKLRDRWKKQFKKRRDPSLKDNDPFTKNK